jgi:hypothetical protein
VGVFGLVLILGFWVYLSALTLVIGAMTVSLHESRHKPRRSALRRLWRTVRPPHPSPAAEAAPGVEAAPEGAAPSPRGDGAPEVPAEVPAAPPARPAEPPER